MKACKKCGVVKPLEDFHRAPGCRDGRRGDCIECFRAAASARNAANPQANRDRVRKWQDENPDRYREKLNKYKRSPAGKRADRAGHLRRKFGMTLDDYDQLLQRQGGLCGICGLAPPEGTLFHVDHDPRTGRVRALLCVKCNNGLGIFNEDPELLEIAAEYLARHSIAARLEALKQSVAG